MISFNPSHDELIKEFSKTSIKGDTGNHVKELVDKVESLKFLRMQTMYENKEVLNDLVRLTEKLEKAKEELDNYMRQWEHGA